MPVSDSRNAAEIYDEYLGPAIFEPWAERLLSIAPPQPDDHVLDLACGSGIVTRLIGKKLSDQGRVVGQDISALMLGVAKQRGVYGPNVDWIESSAESIPLRNDSFDMVYCQQGFQFFPNPLGAAIEAKRLLKPGGRLVTAIWADIEQNPLDHVQFGSMAKHLEVPLQSLAKMYFFGGAEAIKKMYETAGFTRIELVTESLDAVFETPEKYVELQVQAAVSHTDLNRPPEFLTNVLIPSVLLDVSGFIVSNTIGGRLIAPKVSHIAIGFK